MVKVQIFFRHRPANCLYISVTLKLEMTEINSTGNSSQNISYIQVIGSATFKLLQYRDFQVITAEYLKS